MQTKWKESMCRLLCIAGLLLLSHGCRRGRRRGLLLLLLAAAAASPARGAALALVEPPHVAAQAVLVPEHFSADLARDEALLVLVHVPDVAGEGVPGQLLVAVGAGLLLAAGAARRADWAGWAAHAVDHQGRRGGGGAEGLQVGKASFFSGGK